MDETLRNDQPLSSRCLPPLLRWFGSAMVAMVLVCAATEVVCRRWLHLDFAPYDYPLGRTYFPDFVRFAGRFERFHTAAFFNAGPPPFLYPAPAALVYALFYRVFPRHALPAFLSFLAASLWMPAVLFGRLLVRRGVRPGPAMLFPLLVIACSYPVWSVFKQGNIEIVLWLLVTAGVLLSLADRGYSAAVCFGLAASIKIYPVMFFGLLLARRRYREVLAGLCVLVAATVASLWLVCPQVWVSWEGVREGLTRFRWLYALHKRPEIGTDHSLFALFKVVLRPFPGPDRMGPMLSGYLLAMGLGFIGLFFLRIRRLPVENQVICLSVASVLLPPVSYEYTLLAMLLPLALLVLVAVDASGRREPVPGLAAALVCLGLLLGVMPELIWHGQVLEGQVKAVVLLVLFAIALLCPFGNRKSGFFAALRITTRGDAVL